MENKLVRERPILFSGEMVRALLDGRKTQTRRVAKELQGLTGGWGNWKCPYGVPGDRLWVRETFVLQNDVEGEPPPFSDGRPLKQYDTEYSNISWQQPHYRATDPTPELDMGDGDEPCCKWSPAIHMPRWASRITLEILKVRVERVQQITEEDALAEGIHKFRLPTGDVFGHDPQGTPASMIADSARLSYAQLWDKINLKRGFGWESNPWCWCLTFRRVPAQD